jgi:hypothetical protein
VHCTEAAHLPAAAPYVLGVLTSLSTGSWYRRAVCWGHPRGLGGVRVICWGPACGSPGVRVCGVAWLMQVGSRGPAAAWVALLALSAAVLG